MFELAFAKLAKSTDAVEVFEKSTNATGDLSLDCGGFVFSFAAKLPKSTAAVDVLDKSVKVVLAGPDDVELASFAKVSNCGKAEVFEPNIEPCVLFELKPEDDPNIELTVPLPPLCVVFPEVLNIDLVVSLADAPPKVGTALPKTGLPPNIEPDVELLPPKIDLVAEAVEPFELAF